MRFDIITIFPEIFSSYFKESLLARAQEKKLIEINIHNLRDWTDDEHRTAAKGEPRRGRVDDSPFGGGLGMVMKVDPIYKAIESLKTTNYKLRTIVFTPRGKKFNQRKASEYAKLDQLIMICGRYEGVDERVGKYLADKQISMGDYDLMGGELPAMIITETVSRLIPGVIGKDEFLKEHIKDTGFVEYPQYTRPEVFEGHGVPKVLLSGNHKKIEEWRAKHGKVIK